MAKPSPSFRRFGVRRSPSGRAEVDQELRIAVATPDRRGDDAENLPALTFEPGDEFRPHPFQYRRVPDHPASGHLFWPSFELRLEQHDTGSARRQPACDAREHLAERDEGEVGDEETRAV